MSVPDGDPWCLVLSGGGAKGVYHIGAWRAIRELGIPVKAFVGNSIGAIMAGFLAAGKHEELTEIGRSITVETLLALPERRTNLKQLWQYFVEHGGLDTGPMRRLLEEHVNEADLRHRDVDLGIVTINLTDLRPREVFLDEMEPGTLIDYLMASAAFPGFASPEIGGKRYLDGGLWDNLPYDLARSRGWKRIILLDVAGLGWNRRPIKEGSLTVHVKASIDMGGPFDFDRRFLERFETLGYLDTLRAFGRLEGGYTFLKSAPEVEQRLGSRLPSPPGHPRCRLAYYLDKAAEALEVERIHAWSYAELMEEVRQRATRDEALVAETVAGTGRRPGDPRRRPLLDPVYAAIHAGVLEASPYRTLRLVRELATGGTRSMLEKALVALHPGLPDAETYLKLSDSFLLG